MAPQEPEGFASLSREVVSEANRWVSRDWALTSIRRRPVIFLTLTEYLYQQYQSRPIVLIDEYDTPIQCAYDHGFYERAISYFRTWFNNTLKSNEFLNFAVPT